MSSEEAVKQLRNSIRHFKGSLTRIFSYLGSNLVEPECTVGDIQARKDRALVLHKDFQNCLMQLQVKDEEHIAEYDVAGDEFDEKYYKCIAMVTDILENLKIKETTPVVQTVTSMATTSVRLPELKLPEFEGEYDNWFQFKEAFQCLINLNSSLSEVQKYFYLKSCLKGNAAQLISSLEVSQRNYKVAWQLLTERFENERLIVNSHIKAIMELPSLQRENYIALRTLLDDFLKHRAALESLQQPIQFWDTWLIYVIVNKFDNNTRKAWESTIAGSNLPKIQEIVEFLNTRCRVLESVEGVKMTEQKGRDREKPSSHVIDARTCLMCGKSHVLYNCDRFKSLEVWDRIKKAKQFRLCINCLKPNHFAKDCRFDKCRICKQAHHILLHIKKDVDCSESVVGTHHCNEKGSASKRTVLLSTAIVNVINNHGHRQPMRALLDVGSNVNLITKAAYKKLNVNCDEDININLTGVGTSVSQVQKQARLCILSQNNEFSKQLPFLIIEKITNMIPACDIDVSNIKIPKNIILADPCFHQPADIDILLGAEVFYELLQVGRIELGKGKPKLQKSCLGWIVTGAIENGGGLKACHLIRNNFDDTLSDVLQKFWEIEKVSEGDIPIVDKCESEFVNHVERTNSGRFIVNLPKKEETLLGDSLIMAKRRFYNLERKLDRNLDLKKQYTEFMREYEILGHMENIVGDTYASSSVSMTYYIPHLCVQKQSSSTTKLRVVFDASAKTTNNKSLNDILLVGPNVQDSLFNILVRFRKYNVVLTGDIEKMYRQVLVKDEDTDLQRIIWRENRSDNLKLYRLKTVTYGTAPASFLTTRCIKQLAIDNKDQYPQETLRILSDFYMDDLITGGNSAEEVIVMKNNICKILEQGNFKLRKFNSNFKEVLTKHNDNQECEHFIKSETENKTLGIAWNAQTDIFKYQVDLEDADITKRTMLSTIARIFDPLGLVAPVVIITKILLQKLWLLKLDWDSVVDINLRREWLRIREMIASLNTLEIPRNICIPKYERLEMHGFCDASERAYGSVIYLRSICDLQVNVVLVCAKSKVAPIKRVTLPRLELCGAVMLNKLMEQVKAALQLNLTSIKYWTDSKIVLDWLNDEPSRWKTYVANRVAKIRSTSNPEQWHHVSGKENPADLVSRGATLKDMVKFRWFEGPNWLSQLYIEYFANRESSSESKIEERKQVKTVFTVTAEEESNIINRYSSYRKLVKVTAWCLRFIHNTRNKAKLSDLLQIHEFKNAENVLVHIVQRAYFEDELRSLRATGTVAGSSKLAKLNPFVDDDGVIRVGGRLKFALCNYNRKHPIVLPKNSNLTKLIIEREHIRLMHSGPQAVLSKIRETFWPLSGRNLVRNVLRKCMQCFRAHPVSKNQMMGNLPKTRLVPVRPFHSVSCDYAGPFQIKNSFVRNKTFIKAYMCVFVCQTTKAVHLELVTDLSSRAFLDMLKRFVSRRGIPSDIISDNGTNFVGAKNEIAQIRKYLATISKANDFLDYLSENRINWQFLPPRSPHMGGLHEAAVKSAKRLISIIVTGVSLSYENFYTFLCQIEGILNSRPLTPLSSDPSDLKALTPGHFLIGQPLATIPERPVSDIQLTRLKHFEQLQQLKQRFWKRWTNEYIHTLQERSKWWKRQENLKISRLVIVKEDGLPVQQWKLGRIIQVHPGEDDIVRVVTVQTSSGPIKRPVVKICPLPIYDNDIELKSSTPGKM